MKINMRSLATCMLFAALFLTWVGILMLGLYLMDRSQGLTAQDGFQFAMLLIFCMMFMSWRYIHWAKKVVLAVYEHPRRNESAVPVRRLTLVEDRSDDWARRPITERQLNEAREEIRIREEAIQETEDTLR